MKLFIFLLVGFALMAVLTLTMNFDWLKAILIWLALSSIAGIVFVFYTGITGARK